MEPEDDIRFAFDYDWSRVRHNPDPRPQEKGYYRQDWEGFYLHLEEVAEEGMPSSYGYLVVLSELYNVPPPLYKKR
jgi:hypothetical protein